MKKVLILAAFVLLVPFRVRSQQGVYGAGVTHLPTAPSGACGAGVQPVQVDPGGTIYSCQSGTWATVGGSGSGTVSGQASGVVPLGTSATAISSQSHLDDGNTTASTITSSESFDAPGETISGASNAPTQPGSSDLYIVHEGSANNEGGNLVNINGSEFYSGVECGNAPCILGGTSAYDAVLNMEGAHHLVFGTNNTLRGSFDSSGNFGIGSSATPSSDAFNVTSAGAVTAASQTVNGESNNVYKCTEAATGSDDSLKLQYCIEQAEAQTNGANSAIIDAQALTGFTGTVDPFDASPISRSGTIIMPCGVFVTAVPWVHIDNWSLVGCTANSNNGVNYAIGGVGVTGSTLQASSSFPVTYSTGTVAVSGAGYKETVTGTSTVWSTNVVKGCVFVAPAGGYQSTSSWGVIYSVNSNTSLTLGYGHNNGTDVSSGSTYDIFCPVDVLGDASTSTANSNASFQYGMSVTNMSFDANNIAGVVPLMNWFGGQHSFVKNVNLFNYCGQGIMVEGEWAQNSGPYEDIVSAPGTCGVAGSMGGFFAPNGGHIDIRNFTTNQGTSSTKPTIGLALQGNNISLIGADVEHVTSGIAINAKPSCIPACQAAGPNVWGAPGAIEVTNVYAGSNTTNAVIITNSNGEPRGVHLHGIQGYSTNAVADSSNSCTSTSEWLSDYALDNNGNIAFSSSTVPGCQAKPNLQSSAVGGGNAFGILAKYGQANCESSFGATTLSGSSTTTGQNCLPADSIILAVEYRITTTITTATSFTIGDSGSATRYCGTQSTLTSGTTGYCTAAGYYFNSAAAGVKVTPSTSPGAGAIRLTVTYLTVTAPTS